MSAENLNQRRGAAVLLEVLKSEGARYVFGNPGTTELPLIDALVDAPDIRYVLALQEASAVAMADGCLSRSAGAGDSAWRCRAYSVDAEAPRGSRPPPPATVSQRR
jgi:glyoxylate carboligase